MKEMIYAIVMDDSTQWFSFAVKLDPNNKVMHHFSLDNDIGRSPFTRNLFSRKPSFGGMELNLGLGDGRNTYNGWYISSKEFNTMLEASDCLADYEKFRDLLGIKAQ